MRNFAAYLSIGLSGFLLGVSTLATLAQVRRERRAMTPKEQAATIGGVLYAALFGGLAYLLASGIGPQVMVMVFGTAAFFGSLHYSLPGNTLSRAPAASKGHWVRCTPEEIEVRQRQKRLGRIRNAIILACFFTVLLAFIRPGGEERARRAMGVFVALKDVPARLPATFAIGVGFALIYFFTDMGRRKPAVICPRCECAKYEDGNVSCSCGGHFETIEEMKWVNDA